MKKIAILAVVLMLVFAFAAMAVAAQTPAASDNTGTASTQTTTANTSYDCGNCANNANCDYAGTCDGTGCGNRGNSSCGNCSIQ